MEKLTITSLTLGSFAANCYIIAQGNSAVVIDPGAEGAKIEKYLESKQLTYSLLINTHGHVDHIAANGYLKKEGVKLCIHEEDAAMLTDPQRNLSILLGDRDNWVDGPAADHLLIDDEVIEWAGPPLKIIHTPGHTPGSVCILMNNCLFSGDTLFAGGIGRTDLPGGDYEKIIKSIKERLLILPADTIVHPGHGTKTTISYEMENNPFI